ncbi:hypothetical protein IQ266_15130 [filamentous cyanobacterium LEGE 11480]|uniref:Uncharacterized protein n=1 Tax=Romeriopsis navalis LEGE 11480 TaxID=2777977 RepID=A0A928Z333_9CYAN|nr:hypothetical protein [Romeriopsis navalis]MBE9031066.1 hypothetical protein [Romeriopsis navalis LEGE 11480]
MNPCNSASMQPLNQHDVSTALLSEPSALGAAITASDHIRDRFKVMSIFALLAILSSLTPVPHGFETQTFSSRNPTQRNISGSRPSFLSFTVTAVQQTLESTADSVTQTVQTTLWPQAPTGRAWQPLPIQPGWQQSVLFRQRSASLVAKAVGSAEGTRRPDGGKNKAYFGHTDPGNAVWNIGTFSYQHCGKCAPAEADRRQLARLKRQFAKIQHQAQRRYGMQLSLEEQLNAIDLANQAPLAALAVGGFVDRLHQAKQQGLTGSDAILQARVYSYKNPTSNLWEAPGLGNTKPRITRDQARRQAAIAQAIQRHQKAST